MKVRAGIILFFLLGISAAFGQSDNTIHVKAFPGATVGAKMAAAMLTCPQSTAPCILVLDASLGTAAPGTLPALCANCTMEDYRQSGQIDLGRIAAANASLGNLSGFVLVDGVHYANTNAGIQSAIHDAGANGTVLIPPGTFALTATTGQQLLIDGTGATHILCSGWASNLQVQASAAIPLLRVAPSGVSGYVAYGIAIHGCQFSTSAPGQGTYALEVDAITNGSVSNMIFDHNYIGCNNTGLFQCSSQAFGSGSISFTNTTGTGGTYNIAITNNLLYGSISLSRIGDNVNLEHNTILRSTNSDSIYADFYPGSTSFRILENTIRIPLHLGAVTSGSTSALVAFIQDNEWEPDTTSLVGSNGAMLDLDGTPSSPTQQVYISGNSFQIIGGSTLNAIRLNNATQTEIGGRNNPNNFEIGTTPAYGIVTTIGAYANRLNHNIYSSSSWAAILNDVAGNTLVTQDSNQGGAAAETPNISQGSSGGMNIYGANGLALELYGGSNSITDGSSSGYTAAVFSNANSSAPAVGTTASFSNVFAKTSVTSPTITSTTEGSFNGYGACYLASGTLGHCTSAVVSAGTCACAQ